MNQSNYSGWTSDEIVCKLADVCDRLKSIEEVFEHPVDPSTRTELLKMYSSYCKKKAEVGFRDVIYLCGHKFTGFFRTFKYSSIALGCSHKAAIIVNFTDFRENVVKIAGPNTFNEPILMLQLQSIISAGIPDVYAAPPVTSAYDQVEGGAQPCEVNYSQTVDTNSYGWTRDAQESPDSAIGASCISSTDGDSSKFFPSPVKHSPNEQQRLTYDRVKLKLCRKYDECEYAFVQLP